MADKPLDLELPMVRGLTSRTRHARKGRPRPSVSENAATREGDWGDWLDHSPRAAEEQRVRGPAMRLHSMWSTNAWANDGPPVTSVVDRTGSKPGPAELRGQLGPLRGRRMAVLVTGSALVVVGVVALVVVSAVHGGRDHNTRAPTSTNTLSVAPVVDSHAADGCRQSSAGLAVSGTGAGNTRSGPGVILAFNHAYYVERSNAHALEFLAPGAECVNTQRGERYALTREFIQSGINKVAANTRYCVQIEPDAADRWQVEITEQVGSDTTAVTRQLVTTTTVDGRTLIATILAP
jgi:hypothetical protein